MKNSTSFHLVLQKYESESGYGCAFELKYLSLQDTWPVSLCEFLVQSQHLSLGRTPPPWVLEGAVEVGRAVRRGMNPKKLHEVRLYTFHVYDCICIHVLYVCMYVCMYGIML